MAPNCRQPGLQRCRRRSAAGQACSICGARRNKHGNFTATAPAASGDGRVAVQAVRVALQAIRVAVQAIRLTAQAIRLAAQAICMAVQAICLAMQAIHIYL